MISGLKLYAAIGLIGALVVVSAYQTGVNAERKRGEAAGLRVELETLRSDMRLAAQAQDSATIKAAALEAAARQREEELDALRKELASRPEADRRRATGADLDRYHWGP